MEVVHHEVADLHHVMVKFVVIPQEWILLELSPRDLEQLLEELSETREIEVVLLEKLVADGCLAQLHDEVVDCLDAISDFPRVVTLHLVRLHLLSIRFPELGGQLLILLFGDQVLSQFVLWVVHTRVALRVDVGLRVPAVTLIVLACFLSGT